VISASEIPCFFISITLSSVAILDGGFCSIYFFLCLCSNKFFYVFLSHEL
jgi:hypothetical protein